jgi:hypothetical protein
MKFLLTLLLILPQAQAATRIGVGAIYGEPTSATAKFMRSQTKGVDLGVTYSFRDYLLVYSDHLWHFPGAFGRSPLLIAEIRPYFGAGALVVVSTDDRAKRYIEQEGSSIGLGVRIPLGLEWYPNSPLSIYAEVAPGVGVVPTVFAFLQGGIGLRIYF